ncbi:hypothetical protein IW261DRAFT_1478919 [Armillaria novae-zelandiae]|uniref:Uncharacterized protein n=1 Tax=Armillaria novae-zelandiae TaxID=153914 RepID=A0AA39P8V1_9AGAR|nr:hypothetical protein IW261DRAFT_1478919 [Armillaria novae-zelandiae]
MCYCATLLLHASLALVPWPWSPPLCTPMLSVSATAPPHWLPSPLPISARALHSSRSRPRRDRTPERRACAPNIYAYPGSHEKMTIFTRCRRYF